MLRLVAPAIRARLRVVLVPRKTGPPCATNWTRAFRAASAAQDAPRAPKPDVEAVTKLDAEAHAKPMDLPVNTPGVGSTDPAPGASGSLSSSLRFPLPPPFDAALTTLIGLGIVFIGGMAYFAYYKKRVLDKIELAFAPGYDPALELADFRNKDADAAIPHLRRREQDLIDSVIGGREHGHYFVLLGSKGTGKGSMIIDAMRKIDAEGVAIMDCHPDIEVFRQRLGKAINFEYNEDSQTGLFQRRDPREGGAALDIERALNKLEKVGLRCARRSGRPLVLVFNNVHLVENTDSGRNLLLQLQQRAESWAESGVMTVVFTSDDFWPFFVLRKNANRMQTITVADLTAKEALQALQRLRLTKTSKADVLEHDIATFSDILRYTGGRLALLNKVARARDMHHAARDLLTVEHGWLLSRIGLIPDCDDDVMDEVRVTAARASRTDASQQKWSSCSWLLLREFVRLRVAQEEEHERRRGAGELSDDDMPDLPLPSIPFIMTRADFLEELDHSNIIAIDVHHNVRPDSMLILQAARQVVQEDGFDDLLQNVRDRVDEIESLHRTRELTLKKMNSYWFWR